MNHGRGRGNAGTSLRREHITLIGHTPAETVPVPITEAPPLFPALNRKPVPLPDSLESDYLLILRQDFIDRMQASSYYIEAPQEIKNKPQQKIDKLVAQLPHVKEDYNWEMYPAELRPKMVAKRTSTKQVKSVDINKRLEQLEEIEERIDGKDDVTVKEEPEEEENEEELIENYEDEDIDDGTDYANNYFDNGEAFEDEDDNLDDGPIY